jgi:hypothetical protein
MRELADNRLSHSRAWRPLLCRDEGDVRRSVDRWEQRYETRMITAPLYCASESRNFLGERRWTKWGILHADGRAGLLECKRDRSR